MKIDEQLLSPVQNITTQQLTQVTTLDLLTDMRRVLEYAKETDRPFPGIETWKTVEIPAFCVDEIRKTLKKVEASD
jgi:hypothetical protein